MPPASDPAPIPASLPGALPAASSAESRFFESRPLLSRLFGPEPDFPGHLWPRWLFLRALGLIFFSAFYSLAFQIHGLIGPRGILPARDLLHQLRGAGPLRFWYAPTLLWLGAGNRALTLLVAAGLTCSALLTLNIAPRAMILACEILFLSFIGAAQDFASYQSDGMLLEAGFLSFFLAPPGIRPRLGERHPPSTASRFLLLWEWFHIYFESGVVKIASHDRQWRHLTAMDHYYENGPLPTWIGYYVQHLPHAFHAFTVLLTFALELGVVWMLFLPRRARILCFCIVTPFQVAIILTANYAFLNYIVLSLGILLLDDTGLSRAGLEADPLPAPESRRRQWCAAIPLCWHGYATTGLLLMLLFPPLGALLPRAPIEALEPFRIANRYGLFAVMTRRRYEIEFQGSEDGVHWTAYPFRYKPQALNSPPGIYAPYQPRFEWNLWFASLGGWRDYPWVLETEVRLLENEPSVLSLFRANPFPEGPRYLRAVRWQYGFTSLSEKRATGDWWWRRPLGLYAPELTRGAGGRITAVPAR